MGDDLRRFVAAASLDRRGVDHAHDWVTTAERRRVVGSYVLPATYQRCATCRARRVLYWDLETTVDSPEPKPVRREEYL